MLVESGEVDACEGVECFFAEGEGVFDFFVFGFGDDGGVEEQDIVDLEQSVPDVHEVFLSHVDVQHLLQALKLVLLQRLALLVEICVE